MINHISGDLTLFSRICEYAFARAKVEYRLIREDIEKDFGVFEDDLHDLNRKYMS